MAVTREQVAQIYVATFNRAPDDAGLNYWVASGMSIEEIAQSFFDQPETQALHGGTITDREEFVNAIYNDLFNRDVESGGLAYWVAELENGTISLGNMILAIANGAQDTGVGNDATILANKLEVGLAYADADAADELEFFVEDARDVMAGVDYSANSVTAMDKIDALIDEHSGAGDTFVLTTEQDSVEGSSTNDTIRGIVDGTNDTLTLGDVIDGKDGDDTLILNTNTKNVNLAVATISNVEHLEAHSAYYEGDGPLNIAHNAFDTVLIDQGGVSSGELEVNNIAPTTAVTMTNIYTDDEDHNLNFDTDTASTVGNTTVTISDVDMSNYGGSFNTYADFTVAETVNINVNLTDIDDQGNGKDGGYNHYTDLGATTGVAVNTMLNIENVVNADYFNADFYIDQAGGAVQNTTINVTNTDNVYVWFKMDNSGNGTSGYDVATVNLDNVQNSNEYARVYVTDAETFNVNVLTDSELEYIGNYYNGDGSDMGDVTVNLDLIGDLDVSYWKMNDHSGITENTTFNITGAGDLTIEDVDDGNSNVTIDGSAATGNITLGNLESEVVSVTTGSGNDDIQVGSDETGVSTGAGDDRVDTNGLDFGQTNSATLDGGAGTDTVAIVNSDLVDAAYMANIVNFETLEIGGAVGSAAYDMAVMGFTDVRLTNEEIQNDTLITNLSADAVFTMTNTDDLTPLTGGPKIASPTLTISKADSTGATTQAIVMDIVDTNTDTVVDVDNATAVTVDLDAAGDGVETIAFTSNASSASEDSSPGAGDALTPADYKNFFAIDATEMTSLLIDGNAKATVSLLDSTSLTLVDASANTAGVTIDLGFNTAPSVSSVTFSGSNAADSYAASDNGDLVQGNGGKDDITLGAGDDTVRYVSASDSQLTLTDTSTPADGVADTMTGFDVVTGFNAAGTDLIELSDQLNLGTGDARVDILQLGAIGGTDAAAIQAFIDDGVDFFDTGVVDRATAFADDGTNGYLFIDANNDGNFTEADDMVIKLDGVKTMDITDIIFG